MLTFTSIDRNKGVAIISGNSGQMPVFFRQTNRGMHFIETTETGNLNITTIFNAPLKSGGFAVVHSRHVALDERPLPSQSVGTCYSSNH